MSLFIIACGDEDSVLRFSRIQNSPSGKKDLCDYSLQFYDETQKKCQQLSKDITNFLVWAAEPELEERKRIGIKVLLFFIIAGALVYTVKNRLWRKIH